MSDGISSGASEGEKRAILLRNLTPAQQAHVEKGWPL